MFIGHFAVGLGAKAAAPKASLGTLFLAAQFLDLLWPTLLLLNLEQVEIDPGNSAFTPLDFVSYPISHSLLMAIVWGVVFGLIYWAIRKNKKVALVLGFCVVSHWLLDLVVHIPDLPLYPGNAPKVGLGLWNSVPATLLAEGIIFVAGLVLYLHMTRAKNKVGTYSYWALIGFLILIYVGNIFGPPPSSTADIAWVGQLQWLLIIWAYWIDRNREVIISGKQTETRKVA